VTRQGRRLLKPCRACGELYVHTDACPVSAALAEHHNHLAYAVKDLEVRRRRWKALTAARLQGVSLTELGRQLGVTAWAVQQMLEKEPTR
jgi:hypothetical protein